MKKIALDDTLNILEYEKVRDNYRRRIIAMKKKRRIQVGNLLSLFFENRDTVLSQIQEMIRTERIVDEGRIQEEIDIYNSLIPGENELGATMFIEITDSNHICHWSILLLLLN